MIQRSYILELEPVNLWVQFHYLRFLDQAAEGPVIALVVWRVAEILEFLHRTETH